MSSSFGNKVKIKFLNGSFMETTGSVKVKKIIGEGFVLNNN